MSQNSRNQDFSYYISLMIEGSGSGSRAGSGSGSIPLTNGSGSGRPKNKWIRIRNTGLRSSRIWRPPALLLAPPSRLPELFAAPSASSSGRPLRPRQLGPGGGGPRGWWSLFWGSEGWLACCCMDADVVFSVRRADSDRFHWKQKQIFRVYYSVADPDTVGPVCFWANRIH